MLNIFVNLPVDSVVKNPPANAGNAASIPGWGRSSGDGNGNPLQYSCLGNPLDRGAWRVNRPQGHKRVRHDLAIKTTSKNKKLQQQIEHLFICLLPICILLQRNIYLGLLPIFLLSCLLF